MFALWSFSPNPQQRWFRTDSCPWQGKKKKETGGQSGWWDKREEVVGGGEEKVVVRKHGCFRLFGSRRTAGVLLIPLWRSVLLPEPKGQITVLEHNPHRWCGLCCWRWKKNKKNEPDVHDFNLDSLLLWSQKWQLSHWTTAVLFYTFVSLIFQGKILWWTHTHTHKKTIS